MQTTDEDKRLIVELVDRWFADDPGDTCFRTFKLVSPANKDWLRYACDLLWNRDVVVCQVVSVYVAAPNHDTSLPFIAYDLLVRCRWRAPWPG